MAKGGAPTDTDTTLRIRFQPLEAPGRAAALRASLNRYREAGLIGRDMQDVALTTTSSCPDLLNPGGIPEQTSLEVDGESIVPTWLDVYYQSFLDSVEQYSGALPRAVSEMRSSAQLQVRGEDHELAEVGAMWNGEVDSAVAIARLLAYGPSTAVGVFDVQGAQCGAAHKAADIGPTGVPICPPIALEEGQKNVLKALKQMSTMPGATDPVGDFTNFWNQFQMNLGNIPSPLSQLQVLTAVGVTEADVSNAVAYKCSEAKITANYMATNTEATTKAGYPVYYGVKQSQGQLPAGAVMAHFTGLPLMTKQQPLERGATQKEAASGLWTCSRRQSWISPTRPPPPT